MTIIPPDERERIARALASAANLIEDLAYDRVGLADLHRALGQTAPTYRVGEAALDLLADHLAAIGGNDEWLFRWTARLARAEAIGQLRAAAAVQAMAVAA